MDKITEKEAAQQGLLDEEDDYNYDKIMTAEYGDPEPFLEDLNDKLKRKGFRIVQIEDGGSECVVFIAREKCETGEKSNSSYLKCEFFEKEDASCSKGINGGYCLSVWEGDDGCYCAYSTIAC